MGKHPVKNRFFDPYFGNYSSANRLGSNFWLSEKERERWKKKEWLRFCTNPFAPKPRTFRILHSMTKDEIDSLDDNIPFSNLSLSAKGSLYRRITSWIEVGTVSSFHNLENVTWWSIWGCSIEENKHEKIMTRDDHLVVPDYYIWQRGRKFQSQK